MNLNDKKLNVIEFFFTKKSHKVHCMLKICEWYRLQYIKYHICNWFYYSLIKLKYTEEKKRSVNFTF